MGGTCGVREEPGKQNTRRCRAQELARSSAQKNERQKKAGLLNWEDRPGFGGGIWPGKAEQENQPYHDQNSFRNDARFEWLCVLRRLLAVGRQFDQNAPSGSAKIKLSLSSFFPVEALNDFAACSQEIPKSFPCEIRCSSMSLHRTPQSVLTFAYFSIYRSHGKLN